MDNNTKFSIQILEFVDSSSESLDNLCIKLYQIVELAEETNNDYKKFYYELRAKNQWNKLSSNHENWKQGIAKIIHDCKGDKNKLCYLLEDFFSSLKQLNINESDIQKKLSQIT